MHQLICASWGTGWNRDETEEEANSLPPVEECSICISPEITWISESDRCASGSPGKIGNAVDMMGMVAHAAMRLPQAAQHNTCARFTSPRSTRTMRFVPASCKIAPAINSHRQPSKQILLLQRPIPHPRPAQSLKPTQHTPAPTPHLKHHPRLPNTTPPAPPRAVLADLLRLGYHFKAVSSFVAMEQLPWEHGRAAGQQSVYLQALASGLTGG